MWNLYILRSYLLNKIDVSLNNVLNTASEIGEGTPAHVPFQSGEYLSDGGLQAGLEDIGMSLRLNISSA